MFSSRSVIALLVLAATKIRGQQDCDLSCKLNNPVAALEKAESITVAGCLQEVVGNCTSRVKQVTSQKGSEAINGLELLAKRTEGGSLADAQPKQVTNRIQDLIPPAEGLIESAPKLAHIDIEVFLRFTDNAMQSGVPFNPDFKIRVHATR